MLPSMNQPSSTGRIAHIHIIYSVIIHLLFRTKTP